ncbi:hypothetical protein G7066_04130 [Leucobacter coleopterorum]|uniref:Tat (Twin-arginine translocation) pathway signal sequence n=1 Tax=Leucobacter coleopterorum TaxID=2714933 RepID=A0ABX6JUZ8_9MICO|nr:hypothetical protein [Leucobacter coleopterorum]QIM18048.1 hypothetical protein G7066_04130 [Leucobacter coleopterorum]
MAGLSRRSFMHGIGALAVVHGLQTDAFGRQTVRRLEGIEKGAPLDDFPTTLQQTFLRGPVLQGSTASLRPAPAKSTYPASTSFVRRPMRRAQKIGARCFTSRTSPICT